MPQSPKPPAAMVMPSKSSAVERRGGVLVDLLLHARAPAAAVANPASGMRARAVKARAETGVCCRAGSRGSHGGAGAGRGATASPAGAGELERLALQSAVLAPETEHLLDRIGVGGGVGLPRPRLRPGRDHGGAERAGRPGGQRHRARLRPGLRRHRRRGVRRPIPASSQGNAYATGLPGGAFDLVHMRFLASTAGEPERLVAEARRLVRAGRVRGDAGGGLRPRSPASRPTRRGARCSPPSAAAFPGRPRTGRRTGSTGFCVPPGSRRWATVR